MDILKQAIEQILHTISNLAFLLRSQLFCFSITDKNNGAAVVDVFYSDCANTVCGSCLQTPLGWSENIATQEKNTKKILPILFKLAVCKDSFLISNVFDILMFNVGNMFCS